MNRNSVSYRSLSKRSLELYNISEGFIDSIVELAGGRGTDRPSTCPWYSFTTEIVIDIMSQNIVGQDNPTLRLHGDLPKPLFDGLVEWTKRSNKAESNIRDRQDQRRQSERQKKNGGGVSMRPMSKRKF